MHEENTAVLHAVLRSSKAPTGQQLQRFSDFLQSRYHQPVELTPMQAVHASAYSAIRRRSPVWIPR